MHGSWLVHKVAPLDLTVPPQLEKTARYEAPLSAAEVVKLSHAVPDANDDPVPNAVHAPLVNASHVPLRALVPLAEKDTRPPTTTAILDGFAVTVGAGVPTAH